MSQTTLVNGVATQHITAQDRGFLYGQNVFETAIVYQGNVLLETMHLQRLALGCQRLDIPCDFRTLRDEIISISKEIELAVLRIAISMGQGGRGYLNPPVKNPTDATRVLSLHDYPQYPIENATNGVTLGQVDIRLGHQPILAGIKHGNRLEQVIARSQWQAGWDEALILDQHDNVIEATQSNVFIVVDDRLCTPDLHNAGVAGVMREFVLSQAKALGLNSEIVPLSVDDIASADAVFLTNSVIGVWPVEHYKFADQTIHYTNFNVAHALLDLMKEHGAIPTR